VLIVVNDKEVLMNKSTRELVDMLTTQNPQLAVDVLFDLLEESVGQLPKRKSARLRKQMVDMLRHLIRVDVVSKGNGQVISIPLSARCTVSDPSMDIHWL
jgi:hypothetical protein